MEPTIGRFLFFVGSEVLFVIASVASAIMVGLAVIRSQTIKGKYLVLASMWFAVLSALFLFLFIWILTGRNFFLLFSLLAGVSIVGSMVVEIALLIENAWSTAPGNGKWAGQLTWATFEFDKAVPRINKGLQFVAAIGLLVYSVYIGYGYFGSTFNSDAWPKYVMRATLMMLFSFWLLQFPKQLYVMMSPNIHEAARSRIFFNQLGAAFGFLILVSVYLWTLPGTQSGVVGGYFAFSPAVAYATGIYLIAVLVPYVVGFYRAKAWTKQLALERTTLADKLASGLSAPNPALAMKALEEAQANTAAALHALSDDGIFELARETAASERPEDLMGRLSLGEASEQDPRFEHRKALSALLDVIEQCKLELASKSDPKEQRDLLERYTKFLDKTKGEAKSAGGANPLAITALATAAGAVANPVLSAVGKFVAEQFFGGQLPLE